MKVKWQRLTSLPVSSEGTRRGFLPFCGRSADCQPASQPAPVADDRSVTPDRGRISLFPLHFQSMRTTGQPEFSLLARFLRSGIGLALVSSVFPAVFALHSDAGPWVQATHGQAWPLPNFKRATEHFYILRPAHFELRVTGETCDIVRDAIERYVGIIMTEARIARLASAGQPRTPTRDSRLFRGTLEALNIHLLRACTEEGTDRWPRLHMKETYSLSVNETSPIANLVSDSVWGILRGLETFSQLLTPSGEGPSLKVICQTILDGPKFPHRGLLLDTSRHYIPVSDILLTLDAMSYNKLNVFHWHIVDDNSFPFESSRYPDLSGKGAYHPSMVYSPSDVRKVIEYARLRGIRVMPEFDTPGHTRSWGIAYPELLTTCYDSRGNPNGKLGPMNPTNPLLYEFIRNLFAEIVQVFPDDYIHLGGDEVPFDCWASNPDILAYMNARNLSRNFARLEGEYIGQVLRITEALEAKPIVWQEVFDNRITLSGDTAVHVWTGKWDKEMETATKEGHPVLLSACWYLDHLATGGDWKKFYNCDPLGFAGSANVTHLVLGGEACMWSEFVDRNNVHPRVWPRASATAERLWTAQPETPEKAAERLEEHACRMNRRGVPAQPPNGPAFCVT